MRLFLIRHGEAVGNREGLIQGWIDLPLTARGYSQARRTGCSLLPTAVKIVYTSPLCRAWETARVIGEVVGAAVVACDDLREINCGLAEGLPWSEFAARWPAIASAFAANDLECPWPGGESTKQMVARVEQAVAGILDRHRPASDIVAIVSHGGPLAWIIPWLRSERYEVWPPYNLDPCSITEFEIQPSGTATLLRLNDTRHLVECVSD